MQKKLIWIILILSLFTIIGCSSGDNIDDKRIEDSAIESTVDDQKPSTEDTIDEEESIEKPQIETENTDKTIEDEKVIENESDKKTTPVEKTKEAESKKTTKSDKKSSTSSNSVEKKTEKEKKSSSNKQTTNKKQQAKPPKEETSKKPIEEKESPTVTVSVTIPSGVSKGTGLGATNVVFHEGDTVLDASLKTSANFKVRGSGSMAYIEAINGLREFDEGPMSGWQVKVDGAIIDRSAGAYKIKANQKIEWIYTTDYTK